MTRLRQQFAVFFWRYLKIDASENLYFMRAKARFVIPATRTNLQLPKKKPTLMGLADLIPLVPERGNELVLAVGSVHINQHVTTTEFISSRKKLIFVP